MEKNPRKTRVSKPKVKITIEDVRMARMKVTRKYYDTIFKTELSIGEEFECSQNRSKELLNAKVAEIICLKNSL